MKKKEKEKKTLATTIIGIWNANTIRRFEDALHKLKLAVTQRKTKEKTNDL